MKKNQAAKATKTVKAQATESKRDARIPAAGTVLRRTYKQKELVVKVLADGFEYKGKVYSSLSGLAEEITGCKRSGYVFFGCTGKPGKAQKKAPKGAQVAISAPKVSPVARRSKKRA